MSKRVSNMKGKARKTRARQRVKYGWRKKKAMEVKSLLAAGVPPEVIPHFGR